MNGQIRPHTDEVFPMREIRKHFAANRALSVYGAWA